MPQLLNWLQVFWQRWQKALLFTRASALAFSSILALVPLMVLGLVLFSALSLSAALQSNIQDFIFSNFVASSGQAILGYLQLFSARVWQLSWWSIAFLMVAAFGILFSLEEGLNAVWQVPSRHWFRALGLYVVILLLSPLCLAGSFALSLLLMRVDILPQAVVLVLQSTVVLPWVFSFVGFSFIFKVLPNTRVSVIAALLGGVAAALLFELAKQLFTWYVAAVPNFERIYGVVAAIPLFFLWMYLCWLITFAGAVVCQMSDVRRR